MSNKKGCDNNARGYILVSLELVYVSPRCNKLIQAILANTHSKSLVTFAIIGIEWERWWLIVY